MLPELDQFELASVSKGETLIFPYSAENIVGYVDEGFVKSCLVPSESLTARFRSTLSVAGPGMWFGIEVLGAGPNILKHIATIESRVRYIPYQWIVKEASRELLIKLMRSVTNQWSIKTSQSADNGADGVDKVLYIMTIIRESAGTPEVELTQDDLADLTCLSRPYLNQSLKEVIEMGLIEVGRGSLVIADLDKIKAAYRSRKKARPSS